MPLAAKACLPIVASSGIAGLLYFKVFRAISKLQDKSIPGNKGNGSKEKKLAIKMLLLYAFYVTFWTPAIIGLTGQLVTQDETNGFWDLFAGLPATFNSVVAPLVDCLLFPRLRSAAIRDLFCRSAKNARRVSVAATGSDQSTETSS